MTPAEIAEQLREICPELCDLDLEELAIQQESAFQYLENNKFKGHQIFDYGHVLPIQENEYSYTANLESQLAMDEALARSLELGGDFENLYVSEHSNGADDDIESTIGETSEMGESRNIREDNFDLDLDRMTYEDLQELGEQVGSESKGIPADLISQLPTFKFKPASKKKNKETEECVVCCAEFKVGDELTTLPCAHHYHSKCITRWLEMNKRCPVCQKEVFEE
ncbi:probable E3 ubiquitin-protein ligase ZFP1 [Primulina eburnea]|uniref:probable E3 ubiquitin-protein ligase ZFP1 n=1 Tax=Primulina eburnea TaxID=1245227 RepID=UPI003C6C86C1